MSVRSLNFFGGLREIGEDMKRCESSVDMEMREEGSEERGSNSEDCSGSDDMRWEKFIPRGVVRVLLVEADDSTRRIISAHLRKCNYKVAAVADGLKAWEVLKERSHKIDLILTEVDLPSVSGFSLLSLIMEDDYCRNIPVIMMSTQDSIGTVYKCMMRGASDFLMKPIRINELKHVWQHIWRKSSSSLDLEKEAKSASAEEQSQELSGSEKMQFPAVGAKDEGLCSGSSTMEIEKTATTDDDSPRTAIDFIGTFDNKDRYVDQQSNNSIMLDSPELSLSLSRSEHSSFENEGNQPDSPAFPWYTNEGSGSLPNEAQMALPVFHEQEWKVENADPVTDQSGSDSISSGALGNPCRNAQREAALSKFRLKRKERCFEKKIRYESRKQLADKRPRVKGQFVRRIPNSPPNPAAACASAGDYLANERPVFCFSVNY